MGAGQIEINRDVAAKVLAVVDKGLSSGVGEPRPGFMCVEAAVCFALGLPHGDDPACVARAVRSLKICLNDKNWSSKAARAKGLRRLALAQLGSAGVVNDHEFAKRLAELAIRKCVPAALRSAASIQKDPTHKSAMLEAASRCEKDGSARRTAIEGQERRRRRLRRRRRRRRLRRLRLRLRRRLRRRRRRRHQKNRSR
jgi:hypothetical protein